MRWWQSFIDYFFLLIYRLKGPSTLVYSDTGFTDIGYLNLKTMYGYEVNIHCSEYKYEFIYKTKRFKPKYHYLYRVRGEIIGDNAPPKLKKALDTVINFPRLGSLKMSNEAHNKLLVAAYVDAVHRRLSQ